MSQPTATPVLIVDDDETTRRSLRLMLQEAGYRVREAEDADGGLAVLRTSPERMVVFFRMAIFDYCLTGSDCGRVLGAVAEDERLAARHAYIVTTPSPDPLVDVFGHLLAALSMPVVAQPFAMDTVLAALRMAAARFTLLAA